jgi:phospholipase C
MTALQSPPRRSQEHASVRDQPTRTLAQFEADAAAGKLPNVVWVDPAADEHPPQDMQLGESGVQSAFNSLARSQQWAHAAFIVTYDESGSRTARNGPALLEAALRVARRQQPHESALLEFFDFSRASFAAPTIPPDVVVAPEGTVGCP